MLLHGLHVISLTPGLRGDAIELVGYLVKAAVPSFWAACRIRRRSHQLLWSVRSYRLRFLDHQRHRLTDCPHLLGFLISDDNVESVFQSHIRKTQSRLSAPRSSMIRLSSVISTGHRVIQSLITDNTFSRWTFMLPTVSAI